MKENFCESKLEGTTYRSQEGPLEDSNPNERYTYEQVNQALSAAKAGDSLAEGQLIQMLDPLIAKHCRHYFGFTDQDLMQMGRMRALELIRRFDPAMTEVKFLGYMARFMGFYFWDLKKSQLREQQHPQSLYSQEIIEKAGYDEQGLLNLEVQELLDSLDTKQRYVVVRNIMEGATLNRVGDEMELSLEQVKYLKKKALDTMRKICKKSEI